MAGDNDMAINVVEQPLTTVPQETPVPIQPSTDNSHLRRHDFPEGFIFGCGTSAFQAEGAAAVGGKSISVWDNFTRRTPRLIADGSNGNVAADMYHRFEEDIRAMKALGLDTYRFSISWPRILPGGRCSGGVNREGINYYNRLIDTIIAHGMEPKATLYHWDHPDCLELEYGGFLSRKMVDDFVEYAEVCFWEFGDRVTWWTTLNEPWTVAHHGYVTGVFPPGKPSMPQTQRSLKKVPVYRSPSIKEPAITGLLNRRFTEVMHDSRSNPAKDPYTVARNLLLCHAYAVQSYRTKFQPFQNGQIGIVLCTHMFVPLDPASKDDIAAAKRALDFMLGWFLEPVLYGRYPKSMTEFVPAENLTGFTPSEAELLKGSTDYLGLNYYTANYVSYDPEPQEYEGYVADMKLLFHTERDGVPIGEPTSLDWLFVCPWGMHKILVFIKENYPGVPHIIVTENGVANKNDHKLTALEACCDTLRVKYHQDHLANILKAIHKDKVDVRGYFVWSWLDNFEWAEGYTARFGITYVDFINNQARYPKDSAMWFATFLKSNRSTPVIEPVISAKRQAGNSEENVPQKRVKAAGTGK